MPRPPLPLVILTVVASVAGCSSPAATRWPADSWVHLTPEEEGIDSAALADMLEAARAADFDLHEVLVVRRGAVVLDARFFPYDGTRPHDVASVTKTLTALAIGAALHEGAIDSVDARVTSFFVDRTFANDDLDKRAMTLADALTMRAGLACAGDAAAISAMSAAPDPLQYVLDLPMDAPPGTTWAYCGTVSHLLSGVVGVATGMPEDEWLRQRVFRPIGVGPVMWPRDAQGVTHGWGDARMSAEDLARVGLLLLRAGRWQGHTVADPDWLADATRNLVGESGPRGGYGYQTWIGDGGSFHANGRGGQFLFVLPALDLVVVTFGSASPQTAAAYGVALAEVLLPAVHDMPLPSNPAGAARLASAVALVATPPAAQAIAPTPAIGNTVSGARFVLDANPVGWTDLSFEFLADRVTLTIGLDGAASSFSVGVDAVPRITRGGTFGIDPRHHDVDLAAVGRWLDDARFQVTFDTIDRIDAGTLTFTFDAEGQRVSVDLYERTYLLQHFEFEGTALPSL